MAATQYHYRTPDRRVSSRIGPAPLVELVTHGDRSLLRDTRSGVQLTVTGFGQRVWKLLKTQPTLPALIEHLRQESGMPVARTIRDVATLLSQWYEADLIAWYDARV